MNFKKILALLFAVLSFTILLKVFFLGQHPDFNSYYNNFPSPLSDSNPYAQSDSIIYPPLFFILFYPFKIIPVVYSQTVWLGLSIGALILSIFLIFRAYEKKINSTLGFIVLGLSFSYFPVKFSLGMGQINLIILLLISLFFYYLKKKKSFLSSLFLGLSLNLKIFPVLIPLFLLLKKKLKILVFLAGITLGVIAISFLFYKSQTVYYFLNFGTSSLASWKLSYYNQSLSGVLGRSLADSSLREWLRIIFSTALIISISLLSMKKKDTKNDLLFGIFITASLLINSFSWQHHFAWLILPMLITLFNVKKNVKLLTFLLIAFILTAINLKDPELVPVLFQSHVFFGALLLLGVDSYLYLKS